MSNGINAPQNTIFKDFFIYQEDFSNVQASTAQTGNIQIQADSDFALQKLTMFADINGAAVTADSRVLPLVTIQITDSGSGRNLIETPAPIPNFFGNGELPFILPTPKIFEARATVTINIANYSAGTDYGSIRLSFIGYKIFRTGMA